MRPKDVQSWDPNNHESKAGNEAARPCGPAGREHMAAERRFGRASAGPSADLPEPSRCPVLHALSPSRLGTNSACVCDGLLPALDHQARQPRRTVPRVRGDMRATGSSDDSDYEGGRAAKAVTARRGAGGAGGKRKRGAGAGRGAVACQSCRLSKVRLWPSRASVVPHPRLAYSPRSRAISLIRRVEPAWPRVRTVCAAWATFSGSAYCHPRARPTAAQSRS